MLAEPGARLLDFTGRPMAGWITAAPDALTDRALAAWLRRSLEFVEQLPAK
ncbi:hypothetical protein I6A60_30960 [Frankia sp. AgB1.9]|uniref:hypothetical protein n=1 Tax=unclassified Frankia TaxID=2632575 RepID=UPI0019343F40|nr:MULTISPECIES: hypothetical protein [unclassified Frankia]MBL7552250.1 hypothetical protein [Frankia sp. AgB1.9]